MGEVCVVGHSVRHHPQYVGGHLQEVKFEHTFGSHNFIRTNILN